MGMFSWVESIMKHALYYIKLLTVYVWKDVELGLIVVFNFWIILCLSYVFQKHIKIEIFVSTLNK